MAKNRINGNRREDYDDFRESLNPSLSQDYGQVSERDVNVAAAGSVAEQLVGIVAWVLSVVLALRFFTHIFSNDTANGFVNFVNVVTDWMAIPFQNLFQNVPAGLSGFFDFPAIAAIVVVVAVAYLLNRILASTRRNDIV